MGAEDLELKAINVPVPNKEEKKKKKKKRDLVDDEISTMGAKHLDLKVREASGQKEEKKKKNNKRGNKVDTDELHGGNDLDEPTMGEKLASLNLVDDVRTKILEKERSSPSTKLPSADSVHVMLKQALHADDRVMLLDCLYTQDEKVISNSVSLLNASDVLKFLDSLISIIQSRGAVLACALPWLRSLLLQHASGIMSQDSSLLALNSLYQLIESRVSTFKSALQLSSCLDYLFVGISDDMADEMSTITPAIYEDKSESDEDESEEDETEDAAESDRESEEHLEIKGFSGDDGSDYMSE